LQLDHREPPSGPDTDERNTQWERLRVAADARATQLRHEQALLEEELDRLRRKAAR